VVVALASACLWASDGRAGTPPSPDPSTQILPDAAPGGGQTQTPQHSGEAPRTAGEVTPVAPAPTARTSPAPVQTATPTTARSAITAARTAAHRRAEARARKSAAKRAARRERLERLSPPPVRRPPAFFRDQLTPPWNSGPATVSPSKGDSGLTLAALALLLLVVAGGSLVRLSGTAARRRPA
jgi:hypothetical protein